MRRPDRRFFPSSGAGPVDLELFESESASSQRKEIVNPEEEEVGTGCKK